MPVVGVRQQTGAGRKPDDTRGTRKVTVSRSFWILLTWPEKRSDGRRAPHLQPAAPSSLYIFPPYLCVYTRGILKSLLQPFPSACWMLSVQNELLIQFPFRDQYCVNVTQIHKCKCSNVCRFTQEGKQRLHELIGVCVCACVRVLLGPQLEQQTQGGILPLEGLLLERGEVGGPDTF